MSKATSEPASAVTTRRFLGRQAILDGNQRLYGYELLFRSGEANTFSGDGEAATRDVIDHYLLLMPTASDVVAFVNCTREALVSGIVTLLPPAQTVLEILETVEPDLELTKCCARLKEKGYRLALDDFSPDRSKKPFLKLADFIKVDFRASDPRIRKEIYAMAAGTNTIFLAEKVETAEDVRMAQSEGCTLFQGYFFCKPVIVATQVIPQNQLVYLRLLAALTQTPADISEIKGLVESEASICYRLLRLVNSALYGLPTEVTSIRGALMLIGDDEFRKLVTVALAGTVQTPQSHSVTQMALERAKFCELLAPLINESAPKLYLLGMLSLIDVILAIPMGQIMDLLPIDREMKAALLGEKNALSVALELIRRHESGDWREYKDLQTVLPLTEQGSSMIYLECVLWAEKALRVAA